jgi:cholesterol transport system auxiliary component
MKHCNLGVLLGLALTTGLAGCGDLFQSHEPPVTAYAPRPKADAPLVPVVAAVLVVPLPYASVGLDSDRVVVKLPDRRVDVLAGVRWTAPVPELVQALVVDSLRARGGWRAVILNRSSFAGQYLLNTEIRDFSADYEQAGRAPRVRIWLHSEVGRTNGRDVMDSFDTYGAAEAASNRQSAVMAAFETALATALSDLGTRAHAACESAPESR